MIDLAELRRQAERAHTVMACDPATILALLRVTEAATALRTEDPDAYTAAEAELTAALAALDAHP